MSKKIIKFGTDARASIQSGVNAVVSAVQTSYGPIGRTSVIQKSYGAPDITNDGVSIAKAIELEGFEQLGVSLVQEAANKTNDIAGDGTSLTTILSGSLINEGLRVIESGSDPVQVRSGMQKAADFAVDYLAQNAKHISNVDEMADVATISCRNRQIGEMIARMIDKVGKDGVVTVQTGDTNDIVEEVTEGMQFDKGYKSPYFVTDTSRMEAVADKPYILVTDSKISTIQDVLPVIESLAQMGKKELVIIAEDIEGESLATFVLNKIRGAFNVFAVQAPAFGDRRKAILEDIAILTGATFMSSDLGMMPKNATVEDLGSAERVISDKDNTTIVGGKGERERIDDRINSIKQAIETSTSDYDKEKLQERLAKLAGGVGVIKVGAATEVEMKSLKYLVEDALNATKAAVSEGVVAGGASSLIRISRALENFSVDDEGEKVGINIFKNALQGPFRAMARNSGVYDVSLMLNQIQGSPTAGYNFKSMQMVENMVDAGIIDPVLVIKQAIYNAVSVASSIITTEVAIVDEPKKEDAAPAGGGMDPMGGMGGMGMM